MKRNFIQILVFLLLLFVATFTIVACDDSETDAGSGQTKPDPDDEDDPKPDDTTVVMELSLSTNAMAQTRAEYIDEGLTLSWKMGDAVRLFTSGGDVVDWYCRADGSRAFELKENKKEDYDADNYSLFFPADHASENLEGLADVELDYTGQHQTGNVNCDNLAKYTYLTAKTTSLDEAIKMEHHSAQIKFLMTPPESISASSIKSLVFKADSPIFITKAKLDGSASEVSDTMELELSLMDGELNDDNNRLLRAFMMIHPVTLEGVTLTISLFDDEGNEVVKKSEQVEHREYKAGVQQYALFTDNPDLYKKTVISDSNITWKQFGPGMSGNNKSARWHPTDPNYLYISPNMGNSYVSTDGGYTYKTILKIDEPKGSKGWDEVTCVDFSRTNDKFGYSTDNSNKGLFVTSDKGVTWEYAVDSEGDRLFEGTYLSCVVVDPNDDNIWYVSAGRMRDLGQLGFTEGSRGHYTASKSVFSSKGKAVYKSVDGGKSWKNSSAGIDFAVDTESIIINPNDPTMLFLSSNYGFFKSTDSGESWQKITVDPNTDVLRSLSMSKGGNGEIVLYALSNVEWQKSGDSIADKWGDIFKSTDLGETWQNADPNNRLQIDFLALDNYTTRTALNKTASYFFKESISLTAKSVPNSLTQRFQTVVVSPTNPDLVFLTCDYANGTENCFIPGQLWRSTDGGQNWEVAYRNGMAWDETLASQNNLMGNYNYWENRGNTMGNNAYFEYLDEWQARSDYDSKSCNFIAFNSTGEVIHTQNAKISMFSYDGGDTWVDIDDIPTDDGVEDSYIGAGNSNLPGHGFSQFVNLPGVVFCHAGENQLWMTNSGTSSKYPGALAVTNKRVFDEEESSMSWYAVDPIDSNIRYALFFRQAGSGNLYKSTDGGNTWQESDNPYSADVMGINGGSPKGIISDRIHQLSFIIDWNNTQNLYFCVPWESTDYGYVGDSEDGFGVHRSMDGGKSWKSINNGLPASSDKKNKTTPSKSGKYENAPSVFRIAFDPENTNTLYAAVQMKNGGLFRSTDNGDNWSEVESTKQFTIFEGETSLAGVSDIHFAQDGTAYITVGAKNASDKDPMCGLWASYDKMETWHKLFAHANPLRVETARYDPDVILLNTLYNYSMDGLNAGVFISRDGGATWGKINGGNGQANEVNDVAIDYTRKGRYYVSSYGSGWYFADDPLVK